MITREKLLKSKEYWMVKIQTQLFSLLEKYLDDNKMTRTQFANKLGVSKGYVSQILNGDFNHRLSKLIELSLAIDKVPFVEFKDLDDCIKPDRLGDNYYEKLNYNKPAVKVEINFNLLSNRYEVPLFQNKYRKGNDYIDDKWVSFFDVHHPKELKTEIQ